MDTWEQGHPFLLNGLSRPEVERRQRKKAGPSTGVPSLLALRRSLGRSEPCAPRLCQAGSGMAGTRLPVPCLGAPFRRGGSDSGDPPSLTYNSSGKLPSPGMSLHASLQFPGIEPGNSRRPAWVYADGQMGSGWASVLKTYWSRLIKFTSSEKSKKKYLRVSPKKKLSILSLGSGLLGLWTLSMDV